MEEERIAFPRGKRSQSIIEKKLEEIKVSDAMHKGAVVADANERIENIAKIMKKYKIGSVIIMEKGKAVGIVTERDIVRRIVAEGKSPKVKAREVMSTPLRSIREDANINKAIELMRKYEIKKLPVVDKNGRIIGMLTETEITRVLPGVFDVLLELSNITKREMTTEGVGICDKCGLYSENLTKVGGMLLCEECASEEES